MVASCLSGLLQILTFNAFIKDNWALLEKRLQKYVD